MLLTNEVVGAARARQLAALRVAYPAATLGCLADSLAGVRELDDALLSERGDTGLQLDVYAEIDAGQDRFTIHDS